MADRPAALVVHADPIVSALLARAVDNAGGEAITCNSAPAGVMAVHERRFACLIVDADLPGASGLGLLRQWRTLSPRREAFAVLGAATTELIVEALHLGATDVITRPFVLAAIVNRIRPALDRFQFNEQATRAQLLTAGGRVYREMLSAVAARKEEAEIAGIAAHWAMRLLSAEGACVTRVEGGELVHVASVGISARLKGMRAPLGQTFTGRVLQRGRAAFFAPDRMPKDLLERQEWFGMGSGIIAPIVEEGRAVGTLTVSSTRERVFARRHVRILMGLAKFLSLNLVVARANDLRLRFSRRLIAALEAERAHLARELHDETGQSLTAVLVRLTSLENATDDVAFQQNLSALRLMVAKTLEDVGRLARGLRPAALERLDFETVIRSHAYSFAIANGLELDMHVNGFTDAPRLSQEAELTLYRVVQEALTNVARHAKARTVSLVLQRNDRSVRLIAEDDGLGFDPNETGPGMGLSGIRERAALFNGRVMVESERGHGTTLIVDLPMEAVRRVEDSAPAR